MEYTIVDAKGEASVELLEQTVNMKLKPMDQYEVEYTGQSTEDSIGTGISNSAYCKILVDTEGKPQGVFGVADNPAGYSVPWLLTTEEHVITKSWLKHCKEVIFPTMCSQRFMMSNICAKDNVKTKRWLTWLGFSFMRFDDKFDRFTMNVEAIEPDEMKVGYV